MSDRIFWTLPPNHAPNGGPWAALRSFALFGCSAAAAEKHAAEDFSSFHPFINGMQLPYFPFHKSF
jgi:hypothetical protein